MSETRIMTARNGDSCVCGCPTARVRVRGNAFAVTCTDCRASAIVPMLAERELLEAFGESDEIAPVVTLQTARMRKLDARKAELKREVAATTRAIESQMRSLGVEFRLPTP